MQGRFIRIKIAAIFLLLNFVGATAFGMKTPPSKPAPKKIPRLVWSAPKPSKVRTANESFLVNKTYIYSTGLAEKIINKDTAIEMRQQYEDMVRDYELRKRYSLIELQEEKEHNNQVTGFTKNVLTTVRKEHTNRQLKLLRKAAEKDPYLGKLAKPAALAFALYATYNGEPVRLNVSDDTQLSVKTIAPERKAGISVSSPLINTSLDFASAAPSARDPYSPASSDPLQNDERYRISLSRAIPVVDISTGLSYGTTTNTVTTSLSRQLTDHLNCIFDAQRTINYGRPDQRNGQERVSLQYGISF